MTTIDLATLTPLSGAPLPGDFVPLVRPGASGTTPGLYGLPPTDTSHLVTTAALGLALQGYASTSSVTASVAAAVAGLATTSQVSAGVAGLATTGQVAAAVAGLAGVARSGAYGDLTGRPNLAVVAYSGQYADLSGAPYQLSFFGNDAGYAALASPAFTGSPTAPTAAAIVSSAQLATTAFVQAAIQTVIGAAPSALRTLQAIDAQLSSDESAAGVLTTTVSSKAAKGANLSDLASAAAARTNLGLATVAASGAYSDLTGLPAAYALPVASSTVLGGVKVDGTTVTISNGVISAVAVAGGGGGAAGVLPDALPSAVALTSTDGVLVVQPSNASAPHSAALTSYGAIGAAIAQAPPLVATVAAPNPMVLDHTNHGRTLVATGAMTVQPPAVVVNLGSASGDGFRAVLLNPAGYLITFGTNAGYSFVGAPAPSSAVGRYEFYATTAGGTLQFMVAAPAVAAASSPGALTFGSVSTTTAGAAATVVVNYTGGLPASASVTLDGAAATLASGPTIVTTSGSGATAAGTVTFGLTAPAAGTHTLGVSTTGAYAAALSPGYSWTTGAAPSSPKMLDGLTASSTAAFGLRKLRAAYAGSAIRVNRSTDNVQQDIGFTAAGSLDTGALSTFVGSASGTVAKWYDQSGSGNDAVMAYVPSQPTIVSAGTVQMAGGLPTLSFVGTAVGLLAPFAVSGGSLSAVTVVQNSGSGVNLRVVVYAPASTPDYASAASAIMLQNGFATATAGEIVAVRNGAGFGSGTAQPTTRLITAAAVFNGSTASIYANGALEGTGSSTGSFAATGQLGIGLPLNTGGPSWGAPISEVVVFASALSAGDLAAVQSSQKSFYGTP